MEGKGTITGSVKSIQEEEKVSDMLVVAVFGVEKQQQAVAKTPTSSSPPQPRSTPHL